MPRYGTHSGPFRGCLAKSDNKVHLKAIRERKTKKLQIIRKKETIKIRPEINEKEMKETIAKINKSKRLFFEKIN